MKVFQKLLKTNPPLRTNNNSNTNSLQSIIIFITLWKLVILLLFLFVVPMIVVWWDMASIPPLSYDLLKCSHALLKHILVFHCKENLGLFSVPIQVLAYGCLEGLSKVVYIVVTKSNICLQHCYCISSSFG